MRCTQAVCSSRRSLNNSNRARISSTCSGGIHDSGSRPPASSSHRCRASVRSVFARRFGPRAAAVPAGSARCASIPARCSSSTTNRHPVQASTANAAGLSPTALPGRAGQRGADRLDQPAVGIGGHQLHAREAAGGQVAEEGQLGPV